MRHKDTDTGASRNKNIPLFCYRSKGKKVKKARRSKKKKWWKANSIWYILILSPGEIWFTIWLIHCFWVWTRMLIWLCMGVCQCVYATISGGKSQTKSERKYVCVCVCLCIRAIMIVIIFLLSRSCRHRQVNQLHNIWLAWSWKQGSDKRGSRSAENRRTGVSVVSSKHGAHHNHHLRAPDVTVGATL